MLCMLTLIFAYLLSTPLLAIGPGGAERVMRNGQRFCAWILALLGVQVKVRGNPAGGIVVSNHLSYVDILTILSLRPSRFITFTELAKTPGVGLIVKLSQTLFIHRSKPSLVKKDIEVFERELRKGMPFVFFPEGGSFDGEELRPFKSPLFESAVRTETPVQPLCLRYLEINGEPVSLKNRDLVFYHGDMELLPQLLGLLRLKSLTVEAVFMESISASGKTRKDLAQISRDEISKNFLAVQA